MLKQFSFGETKTQKLQSLINAASTLPALLPENPLNFKISGDVIELHINGGLQSDDDYRLAIISSGIALAYLKKEAENLHYIPHIQRFPIVEEARLIAFVRLEKGGILHKTPVDQTSRADLDILHAILSKSYTGIYTLSGDIIVQRLLEACRTMAVHSGSRELKKNDIWNLDIPVLKKGTGRQQALTSETLWLVNTRMNNSVAWLNAGCILGELLLAHYRGLFSTNIKINLLENNEFRLQLSDRYTETGYTQMMLKLN